MKYEIALLVLIINKYNGFVRKMEVSVSRMFAFLFSLIGYIVVTIMTGYWLYKLDGDIWSDIWTEMIG